MRSKLDLSNRVLTESEGPGAGVTSTFGAQRWRIDE
jgi:hypothetical protein